MARVMRSSGWTTQATTIQREKAPVTKATTRIAVAKIRRCSPHFWRCLMSSAEAWPATLPSCRIGEIAASVWWISSTAVTGKAAPSMPAATIGSRIRSKASK